MNPYFYRFCTDTYPHEQRFEVWRDEVNAIFDVDIDRSVSNHFNYDLSTGYVGSLLMGCGTWAGQHDPVAYGVKRSAQMIRRDGLDHIYLCLGITHSLLGYAARTPIRAEPSKIYVLDLARELDSEITAGDTVILTIARDVLNPRIRSADLHGTVLQGPLSALLSDHMFALRRQLPHLSPADMPHAEQATLGLVAAALAPSLQNLADAESEINEAVFTRVRRYIDRNLTSPELTPMQICRDVGISRAQLYRLFAREAGVVVYIQQRRLARIRQILGSGEWRGKRLSTLAFEYGFKSEAHFSRSFRQTFGVTASEAREEGLMRGRAAGAAAGMGLELGSLRAVLAKMAL